MTRLPPELDPQNDAKRVVLAHVKAITCEDCRLTVVLVRNQVCRCRCGVYRWSYRTAQWEWSSAGDAPYDYPAE